MTGSSTVAIYFLHPPQGDLLAVLVFAVVPIGLSIACITICMGAMYWIVRSKAKACSKWTMGKGGKGKGEPTANPGILSELLLHRILLSELAGLFAVYLAW